MGLEQYTEYNVYAASGDGKTFGKISKIFQFRTKGNNCVVLLMLHIISISLMLYC